MLQKYFEFNINWQFNQKHKYSTTKKFNWNSSFKFYSTKMEIGWFNDIRVTKGEVQNNYTH